jgi:signal transduction histidine kinase
MMAPDDANRPKVSRKLDFVGAVTASATHEIKNELAVINEQGQLALEILDMAGQGRQADPQRLAHLLSRVVARVGRADKVVGRLNAFAHSAESHRTACDAAQALELMVSFYKRLAALRRVTLELTPPAGTGGMELPAPPLMVEQAMWAALRSAVEAAPEGGAVEVGLETDGGSLRLRLSGDFVSPPQVPPAELLEPLGAGAQAGPKVLQVDFPLTLS